MGEMVDRDVEHLHLLQMGYYVTAGVTGFFSLFSLAWIAMGFVLASTPIPAGGASANPRSIEILFVGVGVAFLLIGLTITWLTFYAGRSLKVRRHRAFCIVVAALCCLQMPWGTVIGVCTIMVLNRPSVKAMFERPG